METEKVIIPRDDQLSVHGFYETPGRWFVSSRGELYVTCPQCGKIYSLDIFRIRSNGVVEPTFVCNYYCHRMRFTKGFKGDLILEDYP